MKYLTRFLGKVSDTPVEAPTEPTKPPAPTPEFSRNLPGGAYETYETPGCSPPKFRGTPSEAPTKPTTPTKRWGQSCGNLPGGAYETYETPCVQSVDPAADPPPWPGFPPPWAEWPQAAVERLAARADELEAAGLPWPANARRAFDEIANDRPEEPSPGADRLRQLWASDPPPTPRRIGRVAVLTWNRGANDCRINALFDQILNSDSGQNVTS